MTFEGSRFLMGRRRIEGLSETAVGRVLGALHSTAPVTGLTHTHYKYPARFSPAFVREIVQALTSPGDLVMDPFMGGGTTLVEAIAAGRSAFGCDVNPLAGFVTKVKTSPLTEKEADEIRQWRQNFAATLNLRRKLALQKEWEGYDRHIAWWLRKTIQHGLNGTKQLSTTRQRMFARCTLARTAQWAFDCRTHIPSAREFVAKHESHVFEMLIGNGALRDQLHEIHGSSWRSIAGANTKIVIRSIAGIEKEKALGSAWRNPKLILTSPPYAGVHILYHRWQVQGRRETPAPYWIIGEHNENHAPHYTFGSRHKGITEYLTQMRECFKSIQALMDKDSLLVQLVAFSNPDEQLPAYQKTMEELGFASIEQIGPDRRDDLNERKVPNRKWYADVQGHIGASREFLLVHHKGKVKQRNR